MEGLRATEGVGAVEGSGRLAAAGRQWLTSLSGVVEALATVEEPAEFGLAALEALASVVSFELGSYNEVDPEVPMAFFCAFPVDSPDPTIEDLETFPRLVQQNPILQHQQRTGDGTAHRLSDFVSQKELHELELYRRVYKRLGVEFQVAMALTTKAPLMVAFALNRHDADFADDELTVLNLLRPHLIQGYRNVQARAALRNIEGALSEVGKAAIVLDRQGYLADAPPWALQAIEEHFGRRTSTGLPAMVQGWIDEERQREFGDGQLRIHRPICDVARGRQLVLRFVPGGPGRSDVLLVDDREPHRETAELRRLGLTEREAEILQLMTHGATAIEVARQLGVATGTVNKHLQNIYRKLGVPNRTSAIATATDAIFSFH